MPIAELSRLPVWAVLSLQVLEFLEKRVRSSPPGVCEAEPASFEVALANTRYSECASNLRELVDVVRSPSVTEAGSIHDERAGASDFHWLGFVAFLTWVAFGLGYTLGRRSTRPHGATAARQVHRERAESARPRVGLVQW